jgi:anti-sigma28 factor (negative regulator of flagellin synthesis)
MRINSIPPKELLNRYIHVREKIVAEPAISSADEANLTSEALTFSAALKAAKEAIENRTPEEVSRFQEVERQIAEGTYSVPGVDVAKKILGK